MLPYRYALVGFAIGVFVFQFVLIGVTYLRDCVGLPSGLVDIPLIALSLAVATLPYLGILWLHRRSEPGPLVRRL